jgi:hypothetical protein
VTIDHDYHLYTDASYFPGLTFTGWAFVLVRPTPHGDYIIREASGRGRGTNIVSAELLAIRNGLAARPWPNLSTLLLVDINEITVKNRVKLYGAEVRTLVAKKNDDWHMRVHRAARRAASGKQ